MRVSGRLAIAAIAMIAPGLARAADLIAVPTSSNEVLPVADAPIDWSGFYAGVYGVAQSGSVSGGQYGVGVDLGVNTQFDFVLVGAEIAVQGLTGDAGTTAYLQGVARLGVAVSDDILLFGAAGAGTDLGSADESDALLGGGIELAVTDDVSLKAQYLRGVPLSGDNTKDQVTLGANFHF